MWTAEFERFIAPARTRPQLWRVVLGMLLIAVAYVVGFILVMLSLILFFGIDDGTAYLASFETGGTPTLIVLFLGMFALPFLAAMGVARLLHARAGRGLLGPNLLQGFVTAFVIGLVLYLLTALLPLPFELVPNTPLSLFLSFLPVALVALLIQTGAEEVVFRGYLQQQLAARFNHWAIWMIVPSVAFGLLHVDPTAGWDNAWTMLPPTLFGLVAADLTRVSGSIGLAWGLHFLNNCSAILLVSLDGNLSGLSLYKTPFGIDDLSLGSPLIWQEMMTTVIVWACIRLWLARKARSTTA